MNRIHFEYFFESNMCGQLKSVQKIEIFIPLKSYVDFSVIYYIKTSVVALFSVKPMFSVKLMSVKVMYHCTRENSMSH